MEELKVTVTPNEKGEVKIITAQAPEPLPLHEEKIINLSGIISVPSEYDSKRKGTYNKLNVHVVADFTARTIMLVINEKDHFATSVKGTLELDKELAALYINNQGGGGTYNEKQLMQKINFYRRHFPNAQQHEALIAHLKAFKVRVEKEFENSNSLKGQAALKIAYDIKHEVPLDFTLNMPIFCGYEKQKFDVEINLDYIDGEIRFWLSSVGLHEIIGNETERIFEEELKKLADYAIVKKY